RRCLRRQLPRRCAYRALPFRHLQRLLPLRWPVTPPAPGPILVTGAAGQLGAVGRTVTGLLLDRGLPVRALVRHQDGRAAALRAAGAEVVVGDLLEPADVYRVVSGCRRVYFGMSVSAGYLEATVTMAAVAREVGVNALTLFAAPRIHGLDG